MLGKLFNKFEEILLSLLLVTMTILVFVEVIARFIFNYGISWVEELILIINSWMVLIGASYCVREKAHISVHFFADKFNATIIKFINALAIIFCLTYCGIFLYASINYVYEDYLFSINLDDIPIKTWIPASVLVIGFALLAMRFLQALYRVIIKNDCHVLQHLGEVEDAMNLAENKASDVASH